MHSRAAPLAAPAIASRPRSCSRRKPLSADPFLYNLPPPFSTIETTTANKFINVSTIYCLSDNGKLLFSAWSELNDDKIFD